MPLPAAMIGPAEGLFALLWVSAMLLSAANLGLLIWAVIDLVQNRSLSDNERIVWALVVIFVGCAGPILYLVIGRNKPPTPRAPAADEPNYRSL